MLDAPLAPLQTETPLPHRVHVEVTTRCNMRCAMCVKYGKGSAVPEQDLPFALFERLAPDLKHCTSVVLNGIGEPLLHPRLADMAALARKHLPQGARLGFQSNGLLFTPPLTERLLQAGVDTICLSVDSLEQGASGAELHGQGHVARLERSYKLLHETAQRLERPLRLGAAFVLMADSWRELPAVVRWAGEQGVSFCIVTHMLAYHPALQGQSLFNPNTPRAVAIFQEWQAKARERGLDLHDYYTSLWNYHKTDREKELATLAQAMQRDADSRGVWTHLRHLLEWDRRDQEPLRRAVEKAEQAAREYGVELKMPPLMAKDQRRCHFVEEAAAFVGVDGRVSPCQFLLHRFSCHMDGQQKFIQPWQFGNLGDTGLGAIWRSEPYVAFRKQVLDYTYPYCSNCNFVPCDDISGAGYPFEMDCLGQTIPCGHCLWCMGGLQCLS